MPSAAFTLPFPVPFTRPQTTLRRSHIVATAAPTRYAGLIIPSSPTTPCPTTPSVHMYETRAGTDYKMYYGTGGVVNAATSSDGVNWTDEAGPFDGAAILKPNTEDWWWFDTSHLSLGHVALDRNDFVRSEASVFVMYYSGGDAYSTPDGRESGSRIGVALSKDGVHFTRIEGEYPSGAVLEAGVEGDFDEGGVGAPCVIHVAGRKERYVMLYHAFCGRFQVGCAVSSDGFRFRKMGVVVKGAGVKGSVSENGVRAPFVMKRGMEYVMFVEVVDGAFVSRIAMCVSRDCTSWGELGVVLDVGEKGAWDERGVSRPCGVEKGDGGLGLYYCGVSLEGGIGVAESVGEDWTELRRVCST